MMVLILNVGMKIACIEESMKKLHFRGGENGVFMNHSQE